MQAAICRSDAGLSCDARRGCPARSVAAELGVHEHTVGKWRRRFLKDRVEGLLDEARPGRPRTIDDDQVAAVIERTLRSTPATPLTGRSARWLRATGFSHTTIRRIWTAFGLQPHRSRDLQAFERSAVRRQGPRHRRPLPVARPIARWSSASMRRARSRRSIANSPVLPMMPAFRLTALPSRDTLAHHCRRETPCNRTNVSPSPPSTAARRCNCRTACGSSCGRCCRSSSGTLRGRWRGW